MSDIIQLVDNIEFVRKGYQSHFVKQFNNPNEGMLNNGCTAGVNIKTQINTFRLTFIY